MLLPVNGSEKSIDEDNTTVSNNLCKLTVLKILIL